MTRRVPLSSPASPSHRTLTLASRLARCGPTSRQRWSDAFLTGLKPKEEDPQ
jgi:hypothetical protein